MQVNIKTILWDFDGVILNSNEIRDQGFIKVLDGYPKEQVGQLLDFHQQNGGLSRYVKFKFFFEQIRGEILTEAHLLQLSSDFSEIMKNLLVDQSLLIRETLDFIKVNFRNYNMHIVSGSDQMELRYLCESLGIHQYFLSIHGSPTAKSELVKILLEKNHYDPLETLLIGDSINDFEAASKNKIEFLAYNNESIESYSTIHFPLKS